MARKQHHNSISLFPFLAVLVCAMGSLILLLLVMTRKIRQEQNLERDRVQIALAVSLPVAKPDRSKEIADLESQTGVMQQAVIDGKTRRDALRAGVNEQRQQLQTIQIELETLQRQLTDTTETTALSGIESALKGTRQLTAKEAALLRQLDESEKALLQKHQQLTRAEAASRKAALVLQEKNSALISLRAQVQDAQIKLQSTSGTATLLEFSNSTGTTRTPIVIDVTEKGFEILPNGIRISPKDMEGFPVRDNPLLSAVLTAHRHRTRNSLTDEPYVLLLVRPEGCLSFYGAQRVLAESHIHYGYELLEPDHRIVAGEADPGELPVVQTAMDDAFKRRENLYSKLMAIAQQGTGQSAGTSDSGGANRERRLSIRPDGRVVANEPDERRPLDGRYYAGGEAPPASLFRNRPIGGYQTADPGRLSAADAEKLADEFASRYAQQQAAARTAAVAGGPSMKPDQPLSSQSEGPLRSYTEQKFADRLFGGDGSLQASGIVNRSGDGDRAGDPATAGGDSMSRTADGKSSDPALSLNDTTNSTSSDSGATVSRTPEEAWLASAAPAGSKVNSDAASRASGSPGSSANGEPQLLPGDPSGEVSTGRPDLSRIDPDLIRRLQSGRRFSGSLSTPVGITVFLDEHHMTVGQQTAVEVTHDTLDQALATLLTGINSEVNDVRRDPKEPLMPIVKFIISPGGEKWRIPLAKSLKDIGLHSATVFELTPYMISHDDTGHATVRYSD